MVLLSPYLRNNGGTMSYRVVYGETVLECNSPEEAMKLAAAISAEMTGKQPTSQSEPEVEKEPDVGNT